ncbi:MAG TPA: Fic family protein [Nanoarchaeota archaeon]|nr:Fic family protein [Nanoarchaeota archaeon]
MANIKKKSIGRQDYYYLEHSARINGKVQTKEIYLGKEIPGNIEEIKKDFINSIYKEKFFKTLDAIKVGYSKEKANTPKSALEKETETFATKFTYDTQRIEGSTLTLRETANLLERGITPKSKPLRDVKEAESHKKLFYEMLKCKKDISLQLVQEWHRILLKETKADIAGIIRKHQVAISGSKFMPPFSAEVYPLLKEFFSWYEKNKPKMHPVELAALVHLKFVTIHPFGDGNGRISRILMNFVLHKKGYPMLDIPYVGRDSYYNALQRAQVKKADSIFVVWVIKNYIKANKRYMPKEER